MIDSNSLLNMFKALPVPGIILLPDKPHFTIVAANRFFLQITGSKETDLEGKGIFEAFNHHQNDIHLCDDLRQSLLTVIDTRAPHAMNGTGFAFYNISPGIPGEQYLNTESIPLLNPSGGVEYIMQVFPETATTTQKKSHPSKTGPSKTESISLNEQRFKSLVQNGSDLIAIVDMEANYKYASPSHFTVLGISSEELLGKNAFDFIHPEDTEFVKAIFVQLAYEKRLSIPPYRFKDRNEKWRWFETIATNMTDDPAVNGIVTNCRDITERKAAEEQLKFSEEKYKLLFQLSPQPKWMYDIETFRIVDVNETAINHYGYSRKEFLQMTLNEIRPEREIPTLLEFRNTIKSREGILHFGVFTHLKKNRQPILVEVSGHQFVYRGKPCMIVACIDVTERENALQELKNKEAELLAAQKIARLGYWQLRVQGNVLYWSDLVYDIWGVKKENFDVSYDTFLRTVLPEDRDMVRNLISESLEREIKTEFEYRIVLPDGSEKWIKQKSELTKNELGENIFLEGTLQDITKEKLLELSLEVSNQRYEYVTKATSDAIWDWNLITNEVYWGEGFQSSFGYNLEGLISDDTFWTDHIHPEDYDRVYNGINGAMEGIVLNWVAEYRFQKLDGTYADVIDRGFVIRDEHGKAIRMVGAMQDISDKKKADAELLQFKNIIDNSQTGIGIRNARGNLIYINSAFEELLGYSRETLQQSEGTQTYADQELADEVFKTIYAGNYWQGDVDLINSEGKIISFHLNAGPVFDKKGELIAVYGIHTDITERKKAQQELQDAFNERNTILESIGDAFFTIDKNWIVTYWNKEAEKVLRVPKNEILGQHLWEVFSDSIDSLSYKKYHHAIEANKVIQFEDYYAPLNMWCEISVYPSPNGLSVYFKDVTERKEALEQLRQSNERFERVAEASNDAIWDLDIINNIMYRGDGFRKLLGNDFDKEVPNADHWVRYIHPDDRPGVESKFAEALHNEDLTYIEGDFRFAKWDGSYINVKSRAAVVRDEKGNAIRLVGSIQDITHRIEYEASLRALNADLERINRELAISNSDLEHFAYVASHDLQEPLRMVTGFLTQLGKKYGETIDETGKKYIHFAVDGAQRMRQIISDLLEFSRVGRMEDKLENIDLNELVTEILILHRNQILDKKAMISRDQLPVLKTARSPMRQVFQNLVGNSLKYHSAGVEPKISITASSVPGYWLFAIADNGIGINTKDFDKIFVIFHRLHNKEEYSGTGMGLAITKKIVENLGGKIWVESEPGKGSTFYFTIPRKLSESEFTGLQNEQNL